MSSEREMVQVPRDLLESLHEDSTCHLDHHGGCQEHGYISLEPGEICPQKELGDILAGLAPKKPLYSIEYDGSTDPPTHTLRCIEPCGKDLGTHGSDDLNGVLIIHERDHHG